jgi:hypothetical protein
MTDANNGGRENIFLLVSSQIRLPAPYALRPIIIDDFQEAIVTNNRVLADVVTKTIYFSLAAAAFVFISMLLLTGLHS